MLAQSNNGSTTATWTFLSNHAYVLICIAADPETRMRDVAGRIGITERAVQRIVAELEEAGFLTVTRVGRRNRYEVNGDMPFRHPIAGQRTIADLIDLALGGKPKKR
jgi:hypothetical protein